MESKWPRGGLEQEPAKRSRRCEYRRGSDIADSAVISCRALGDYWEVCFTASLPGHPGR